MYLLSSNPSLGLFHFQFNFRDSNLQLPELPLTPRKYIVCGQARTEDNYNYDAVTFVVHLGILNQLGNYNH